MYIHHMFHTTPMVHSATYSPVMRSLNSPKFYAMKTKLSKTVSATTHAPWPVWMVRVTHWHYHAFVNRNLLYWTTNVPPSIVNYLIVERTLFVKTTRPKKTKYANVLKKVSFSTSPRGNAWTWIHLRSHQQIMKLMKATLPNQMIPIIRKRTLQILQSTNLIHIFCMQ